MACLIEMVSFLWAHEFGLTAFPTKILLDGDGNIVATFIGNSGGNELGDKLHELLDTKN